ncbi:MAG: hypothetical protein ACAI25_08230 [Planctomycetota bacterium]
MSDHSPLLRGFERAGVPLELALGPFVRGVAGDEIVQMDVRRRNVRGRIHERVLLWPGKGAEIGVLGADAELNQLVLRVLEPRRKFIENRWDAKVRKTVPVVRWTSEDERRFLVGMDEAHLFVAQLTTRATTVADAHRGLRPSVLESRPEAHRQGEWFFVPATSDERELIGRSWHRAFLRNEPIGGLSRGMRGRPHYAEQLVRFTNRPDTATGRAVELVRGRIRHPDHAVLELKDWMRVFMNTEDRTVNARWVD